MSVRAKSLEDAVKRLPGDSQQIGRKTVATVPCVLSKAAFSIIMRISRGSSGMSYLLAQQPWMAHLLPNMRSNLQDGPND